MEKQRGIKINPVQGFLNVVLPETPKGPVKAILTAKKHKEVIKQRLDKVCTELTVGFFEEVDTPGYELENLLITQEKYEQLWMQELQKYNATISVLAFSKLLLGKINACINLRGQEVARRMNGK